MTVGVSFSGGGIRSAASLGIYSVLENEGIHPNVFTGTSSGAIVASLLATGHSADGAIHKFELMGRELIDIAYWHIIKGLFTSSEIEGFVKGKYLQDYLEHIFDGEKLSEIEKPLGIISTNLSLGRQEIFVNSGLDLNKINDDNVYAVNLGMNDTLSKVVRMSCSIPGVFVPYKYNGCRYVDGGITNNLPCDVARALGAEDVVSIDLGYDGAKVVADNYVDILTQSLHILMERVVDNSDANLGIYLNPGVVDVNVLDFTRMEECYERGKQYARENIGDILKELGC